MSNIVNKERWQPGPFVNEWSNSQTKYKSDYLCCQPSSFVHYLLRLLYHFNFLIGLSSSRQKSHLTTGQTFLCLYLLYSSFDELPHPPPRPLRSCNQAATPLQPPPNPDHVPPPLPRIETCNGPNIEHRSNWFCIIISPSCSMKME